MPTLERPSPVSPSNAPMRTIRLSLAAAAIRRMRHAGPCRVGLSEAADPDRPCPSRPAATPAIARLIAERMQTSFKQPVVLNRTGGNNIGAASVATADPDGYTMLLNAPASFVINQFIYKTLTYDPDTAFAPACLAAKFPNVLVVHPSSGIKTIQQLIDKAKASPGKVQYAIAGIGATNHLAGALFSAMAGVDTVAIPYKGTSQSLPDLVAGRVDFTIDNLGPILPFIKSGQLIALGVTTPESLALLAGRAGDRQRAQKG